MRSRYCAYVLGLEAYLRETWHPDTCPADLAQEPGLHWLGLKIGACEGGKETDEQGSVSFVARYRLHGRGGRMQEKSHFVRHQGRWVYLSGEVSQA
jgi:SEC-C motif-containing protein